MAIQVRIRKKIATAWPCVWILVSLGAALVITTDSKAELLPDSDTIPSGFQLNATRAAGDDLTLTLQDEAQGMALTGSETHPSTTLLGSYGTTVHDVLRELAPHLSDADAVLADVTSQGDSVHERWEFTFRGLSLHKTNVNMHFFRNQLVLLRASLPSFRLVEDVVDQFEFIDLKNLGFTLNKETHHRITKKVLANAGGMLAPAWLVYTRDLQNESTEEMLIDARNGAILDIHEQNGLPLAHVYEKGPVDGTLIETDLPYLAGDGYLDGQHFSVFAPDIKAPRVMGPDNEFFFNPDDFADQLHFDQVQAYYSATKALDWYRQRLGYEFSGAIIPLRVNDLVKGNAANALYIYPPFGPEIKIGKGNDTIRNLARDTDVMFHEFSHHVVYAYLKSTDGESGILHEGYADYFAYAINGDPYLGESVVAGKPYLRTAKLDAESRYDDLDSGSSKHEAGQIWSAVLWQIHEDMALSGEKLIYQSLPYLGAASGFRDAILALLNADRDLYPLDPSDPEYGIYGTNKCPIISAAVERGFATFIETLDGSSCNMNLTDLAQISRELRDEKNKVETKGKGVSVSVFGRKCSVIDGRDRLSSTVTICLLFLPLFLLIFNRFRSGGILWISKKSSK